MAVINLQQRTWMQVKHNLPGERQHKIMDNFAVKSKKFNLQKMVS
jgi:hypothetical protein